MDPKDLPAGLTQFTIPATSEVRRIYGINAERHDALIGDDAIVFGVSIYRNSWFILERIVEDLDGWTSSRPDGSLVICGAGYRIHVYRYGQDEAVDVDAFRLDDAVSETKRSIAVANGVQLTLDFPSEGPEEAALPEESDLRELVIIHAGNPDDGCCGIWIGAPIPADEVSTKPWKWIRPLWLIDRPSADEAVSDRSERVRHDELPEPLVDVEPLDAPGSEELAE